MSCWFYAGTLFKTNSFFSAAPPYCFLPLFFPSVTLTSFALYMSVIFYESVEDSPGENTGTSYVAWLGLALVGFFLTLICLLGIRGAYMVSLELLLLYFWGVAVFLAPLLLGTVFSFDFLTYIRVYLKHNWEEDSFLGVRRIFCKKGTAEEQCRAPVLGGPNSDTVGEWCQKHYDGATDCSDIREEAVQEALVVGRDLTLIEASVGILNSLEILFSMYLCFRILTAPVIEKSMLEIINYLLCIPIGACCWLSYFLWWMREHELSYSWLTSFYIGLAVGQVLLIPMGVLAGRFKHATLLLTYIISLTIMIFGLGGAGVACMLFSVVLPEEFLPTADQAGDIACSRELPGCCCCDFDGDVESTCPEWGEHEVVQLSVLDLKMAGILSFICVSYLLGALIVAWRFQTKLKNYQVEYI